MLVAKLQQVRDEMRVWGRWIVGLAAFVLIGASSPEREPRWGAVQVAALREEAARAIAEGLPAPDMAPLDRAVTAGDPAAVNAAAHAIAMRLARMLLLGCATPGERKGWAIPDSDSLIDVAAGLDSALEDKRLGAWFAGLRPRHPTYAATVTALAQEHDPARRTQLARNLERWRWLPRDLGQDFVLVNAAAFEAELWRGGEKGGIWRVIVGKPASPTPVFAATISGVTLNPWWEIPPSIAREGIAAMVRSNPARARERGYVLSGGRYRQRPGPNNALGQMKLVMPNSYNVYLHDTPNRDLFEREVCAFSHGCIRVGDALGLAAALLEGAHGRDQVDRIVSEGKTTTLDLSRPVPVYITYFTAWPDDGGMVRLFPDLYGRDGRLGDAANPARRCAY